MNKYASINWNDIKNFSSTEFPEDPNKYANPELIYVLQDLRVLYNMKIYPSPVSGALARFTGSITSQHYVGSKTEPTRLSTGIDVFPEGVPFAFLCTVLKIPTILGIGIYIDTNGPDGKPWVMFHLDIRRKGFTKDIPLIWVAKKINEGNQVKTKYYYPQTTVSKWAYLTAPIFYKLKIKN